MNKTIVTTLLLFISGVCSGQGLTGGTSSVGHAAAPYLTGTSGTTTKWYVATDGNPGNSGHDSSSALELIQHAISHAVAGDSIFVKGGTYNETLLPVASGNNGSPITIVNFKSQTVLVRGADGATNGSPKLFDNYSYNYVTLQGLHFWWRGTSTNASDTYVVNASGEYNIFRYCTLTNSTITDTSPIQDVKNLWNSGNQLRGIVMSGVGNKIEYSNVRGFGENIAVLAVPDGNNIIQECWSHLTTFNCILVLGTAVAHQQMHNTLIKNNLLEYSAAEDGVQWQPMEPDSTYPHPNNYGTYVTNNVIRYCAENALDMKGSSYIVLEKNVIYGIDADDNGTGVSGSTSDVNSGNPIDGHSDAGAYVIIRYNIIYDCNGGIWMPGNTQTYNNTIVSNNRTYAGSGTAVDSKGINTWNYSGSTRRLIINNISMNHVTDNYLTTRGATDMTIDNNLYYNTVTVDDLPWFIYMHTPSPANELEVVHGLPAWKTAMATQDEFTGHSGKEVHSVSQPPQFTDVVEPPTGVHTSYDFTPVSTSPLVNAGRELTFVSSSVTSNTITVDNSYAVCDGFGIAGLLGDSLCIMRGATQILVRVTSVDYSTHSVTLDRSVTVVAGDLVFFWPFVGVLPDIGAKEYGLDVGPNPNTDPPPRTTNVFPVNGTTETQPVVFRWRTSATATNYYLCMSVDNWSTSINYPTNIDTFRSVSGLPANTQIVWNVRAENAYGWFTPPENGFSDATTFTTALTSTPSDTVVLNWNLLINQASLVANSQVVITNLSRAFTYLILHNPDGKTVTWDAGITWPGDVLPSTPESGSEATYLFVRDTTRVFGFDLSSTSPGAGVSSQWVLNQINPATLVLAFIDSSWLSYYGTTGVTPPVNMSKEFIVDSVMFAVTGTASTDTVAIDIRYGVDFSTASNGTGLQTTPTNCPASAAWIKVVPNNNTIPAYNSVWSRITKKVGMPKRIAVMIKGRWN